MPQHVVVTETGVPYAQRIETGTFLLSADEPVAAGGGGSGPDPYALLLAALGACTSMTLRMYANRKGWPLDAVSVRVGHERIHSHDCAECETSDDGRVDRFTREIRLTGALSEDQKRRLVEIADRCPVHRTLMGQKTIETRLVEG